MNKHDMMMYLGHRINKWWIFLLWAIAAIPGVKSFNVLDWSCTILLCIGLALNLVLSRIHGTNLCEACIADFPLNAQEQAAQSDHTLKSAHFLEGFRGMLALQVLIFIGILIFTSYSLRFGKLTWRPGFIWICLITTVTSYIFATHTRLRPACPYCRRHDGGSDDDISVPTPDPVVSA